MSAQMRLKTLSFDNHHGSAGITSESALYMIGAVDEVKAIKKEEQQTEPSEQQQEKENNVSTDAT